MDELKKYFNDLLQKYVIDDLKSVNYKTSDFNLWLTIGIGINLLTLFLLLAILPHVSFIYTTIHAIAWYLIYVWVRGRFRDNGLLE